MNTIRELTKHRVLLVATFLVLLFFCTSIVISARSVSVMTANNASTTNTLQIINDIKDLKTQIVHAESGQRGYLLTYDEEYLIPFKRAQASIFTLLEQLSNSQTALEQQQERFTLLYELTIQKLEEMTSIIELVRSKQTGIAIEQVRTDAGNNLMQEIDELIGEMETTEQVLLERNRQEARENRQFIFAALLITNVIGILLILGIFSMLYRHTRRINQLNQRIEKANATLEAQVEERTEQLSLYAQELERSNRELEEFAFVASHDLQEPLRKIQAFGDRLKTKYGEALGERGADYINRMNSASSRMSLLITDLLSFSRVTTRQKPFETTDLDNVINQVLDDLEIAIDTDQADIQVEPLPTIDADESQLSQVFLNLLSNSLKFHRPGVTPVIHIKVREGDEFRPEDDERDWIEICFIDNGIGFKDEYKDRVFNLFQRLHGRDEYSGTGIGLALCRKIIERHGGTIAAESEVDIGTTFRIRLPKTQIELVDVDTGA